MVHSLMTWALKKSHLIPCFTLVIIHLNYKKDGRCEGIYYRELPLLTNDK